MKQDQRLKRIRCVSKIFQIVCVIYAAFQLLVHLGNVDMIWRNGPWKHDYRIAGITIFRETVNFPDGVKLEHPQKNAINELLMLMYHVLGIFVLYRLFNTFKKGIVFAKENIRRIKILGMWLVGWVFLPLCIQFWFGLGDAAIEILQGKTGGTTLIHDNSSYITNPYLWGGLLIFLIAWIMEEGLLLKEDQELTI